MRPIDADVLIDEIKKDTQKVIKQDDRVGSFWLGYIAGLVIKQPSIQPEPTDINAKEAVYNLAEKIGIHQLFALTVELRGEPIQPEPQEGHWIEGKIYRDVIECNCSECGQLMTTAASVRMNYCPNCGAKMTISTK